MAGPVPLRGSRWQRKRNQSNRPAGNWKNPKAMSFFSSIPTWGWLDILFNFAVLVALCGESHWALKWLIPNNSEGKTSAKWRREKLKKRFEFLLIIGIAGEVGCLPFSLYESAVANKAAGVAMQYAANSSSNSIQILAQVAVLNKEAADARLIAGEADERAANTASNNLALRSVVLELEAKSRWRTITPDQKRIFIDLTKNVLKLPIRVRMANHANAETGSYGNKIRELLDDAGFVETNKDLAITHWPPEMDILWTGTGPELPPIVFLNNISTLGKIVDLQNAQKELKSYPSYLTNTMVITEFVLSNDDSEPEAYVTDTNGSPILHIKYPGLAPFQMVGLLAVQSAFNVIGIQSAWMTNTNIPAGMCEIFINPK
jgi:hypothetical protein